MKTCGAKLSTSKVSSRGLELTPTLLRKLKRFSPDKRSPASSGASNGRCFVMRNRVEQAHAASGTPGKQAWHLSTVRDDVGVPSGKTSVKISHACISGDGVKIRRICWTGKRRRFSVG